MYLKSFKINLKKNISIKVHYLTKIFIKGIFANQIAISDL